MLFCVASSIQLYLTNVYFFCDGFACVINVFKQQSLSLCHKQYLLRTTLSSSCLKMVSLCTRIHKLTMVLRSCITPLNLNRPSQQMAALSQVLILFFSLSRFKSCAMLLSLWKFLISWVTFLEELLSLSVHQSLLIL